MTLTSAGCTELVLQPYRDDGFLANYHYGLGEEYIEIDGLRYCYQERGSGDNLLILPGLGTSIAFWELNIPTLASQYHVVAVDPPGFGKSDKPDVDYDLPWVCDRVVAFLDAKGIERTSILGGSMGGHLAMLMALAHPERVDKLILMGSSGSWEPPGFLLAFALRTLWSDAIVVDHMRRNWPNIYAKMFLHHNDLRATLLRYQMAMRADPERYAPEGRAFCRAMRSIFFNSCRDHLGRITNPVLLIWGEHDEIHPYWEGRVFRQGLPNSRLVVVPDAGHEVMVDKPDEFNRLVLTFLKEGTQGVQERYPNGRDAL